MTCTLTEVVGGGRIRISCSCGKSLNVPDKGMGRATAGAFRTQHQSPARG